MRCPFCRFPDSRVVDSREVEDGQAIRRRRSCPECQRRFTTLEGSLLSVVKRSGVTEPFSRSKVIAGVTRACQGRPVDPDEVAQLAQLVEETVRGTGQAEVQSQDVGLAILGPLRELDEVAYLRFASVYRSFSSAEDFAAEIRNMRARASSATGPAAGGPSGSPSPDSTAGRDAPTSPGAPAAPTSPTHAPDRSPPIGVG
jgi:transcriptional repressor NrdR